jgi:hypothetical protein
MLMLAGVCHFAAMSQGPVRPGDWPGAWEEQPTEHGEAGEDAFLRDLYLAIVYHSHLARLVAAGSFDECYEPRVEAVIYEGGGQPRIQRVRGHKST